MASISPDQKTFKNTFAPNCGNEELTADMIIAALRTTVMHSKDLPKEVQDAVEEELAKRSEKTSVQG